MNHLTVVLTLASLWIAASSCTGSGSFSGCQNLPEQGWAYGDTLFFDADTTVGMGTLTLSVAHDNDYPYANLWLEVSCRDSRGRLLRDTVDMTLADPYGHWLGTGFGPVFQKEQPLMRVSLLPGSKVAVRHIMRLDTLRGLTKVMVRM